MTLLHISKIWRVLVHFVQEILGVTTLSFVTPFRYVILLLYIIFEFGGPIRCTSYYYRFQWCWCMEACNLVVFLQVKDIRQKTVHR